MKRMIVFLFAFVCLFTQSRAEEVIQVITDAKIENPGSQHGGGQRGPA